jgi:hypothetical protein
MICATSAGSRCPSKKSRRDAHPFGVDFLSQTIGILGLSLKPYRLLKLGLDKSVCRSAYLLNGPLARSAMSSNEWWPSAKVQHPHHSIAICSQFASRYPALPSPSGDGRRSFRRAIPVSHARTRNPCPLEAKSTRLTSGIPYYATLTGNMGFRSGLIKPPQPWRDEGRLIPNF